VFIDLKTLRPVTVLPEIVAAYAQGDPVETAPRNDPLPSSEPPESAFALRRRVEWRDIDAAGHVNNAIYAHFAEDCGLQAQQAYGWPVTRLDETGCRIVAARQRIEYKSPARLNDELAITTWLSHVEPTSMLRHYLIRRGSDGQLLTQIRTIYRWVDAQTYAPVDIPQVYRDDLAANTAHG